MTSPYPSHPSAEQQIAPNGNHACHDTHRDTDMARLSANAVQLIPGGEQPSCAGASMSSRLTVCPHLPCLSARDRALVTTSANSGNECNCPLFPSSATLRGQGNFHELLTLLLSLGIYSFLFLVFLPHVPPGTSHIACALHNLRHIIDVKTPRFPGSRSLQYLPYRHRLGAYTNHQRLWTLPSVIRGNSPAS